MLELNYQSELNIPTSVNINMMNCEATAHMPGNKSKSYCYPFIFSVNKKGLRTSSVKN